MLQFIILVMDTDMLQWYIQQHQFRCTILPRPCMYHHVAGYPNGTPSIMGGVQYKFADKEKDMKRILMSLGVVGLLSGCVVADPYYVPPPRPVYVQPAPVYVPPRPVYVAPPPRCFSRSVWDPYLRVNRVERVCR